jgi:hypothetical protein
LAIKARMGMVVVAVLSMRAPSTTRNASELKILPLR